MYFSGKLTIDPAQVTHIQKVRPQKAFRRMLHHLTAGLVSDQEEQEPFAAVAVLQQMNHVFRQMGIADIIRLAHDDIDFYLDPEGKKGDLKDAFYQYDLTINEAMAQVFKQLFLVLEHQQDDLYYLIEVTINRTHAVGDYPSPTTPRRSSSDPVFGDYYSTDDYFLYFLLWSDMVHDHHIHIQDTDILTEGGELLGTVGDEAVDAADLSVLSEDTTYEEGMQDVPEAVEIKHEDYAIESDGSSWFDGDGGSSDSDTLTSGCSSCSSCASCGGD